MEQSDLPSTAASQSGGPPGNSRRMALATGALLVLVAFAQFGFLTRHSLRNNDFITTRVIRLSYAGICEERPRLNHMPGYFLALKAWTSVAGKSEAALRLPSALAGFLGILLVWRVAARLHGPSWGLLALALAGLNQVHALLGTDVRMYSWVFLGAALATWAFLLYLDTGRHRYAVVMALAGAFTLAVQTLYTFIALPIVVYVLVRRRALRGRVVGSVAAALIPFLLLLPVLLYLTRVESKIGRQHAWRPFRAATAARQMADVFLGDDRYCGNAVKSLGALWLAIGAGCLAAPCFRRRPPGNSGCHAQAPAWACSDQGARSSKSLSVAPPGSVAGSGATQPPYTAFFLLSVAVPVVLIPLLGMRATSQMVGSWRYYITAGAAAPLLMVAAVRRAGQLAGRTVGVLYAASACALVLANLVGFLASPGMGVREAARYLGAHRLPGDVVVASQEEARSEAFTYYGAVPEPIFEPRTESKSAAQCQSWLQARCAGASRLWVAFYLGDEKGSAMADALRSHPETYVPVGKPYVHGETVLQLYQLRLR